MYLFKITGIALIVASSSLAGFLKSKSLIQRRKKISLLLESTDTLYSYICEGEAELDIALKNAYEKCDFLKNKESKFLCDDADLKPDKAFINEFFSALGNSTKKVECDRINSFKIKLASRLKEAENDILQKAKIYQTLGICAGLIVGILLI